eukprot:5140984-Alexandrium_andersonii.AAC.1
MAARPPLILGAITQPIPRNVRSHRKPRGPTTLHWATTFMRCNTMHEHAQPGRTSTSQPGASDTS